MLKALLTETLIQETRMKTEIYMYMYIYIYILQSFPCDSEVPFLIFNLVVWEALEFKVVSFGVVFYNSIILNSVLSVKYLIKFLIHPQVWDVTTMCHVWNQKVIHFLPLIYMSQVISGLHANNSLVVCRKNSQPHFIYNITLYVFQSFFVPLNKTFLFKCSLNKQKIQFCEGISDI